MRNLNVTDCTKCEKLCENRTNIVNGEGSKYDTEILFIGEAPGKNEDEQERPFIGKSGQILRDFIDKYELKKYRITNSVRCRPPENRDPTESEKSNCRQYLDQEVLMTDPNLIVTLGKVPGSELLDRNISSVSYPLLKARGLSVNSASNPGWVEDFSSSLSFSVPDFRAS